MPYEIKLEQWSGPLEKLLELIEAEKMNVNEVSLAAVTDGFLKYLEKFRQGGGEGDERFIVDLRILADFISVASKLIFLKSKYLLPGLALTEEEETDIKELEARLKHYQALKPALKMVSALWRESHRSYSRPYFFGRGGGLAVGQSVFYPVTNLNIAALRAGLTKIFESVTTYAFETETIREKIITLEEKISEVLGRVKVEGDMQFKRLSGEKSRSEMIVLFLAVLHLAREQLILLEQMDNFSDIMVKKK
jgi:segregation and condensation protein A